MPLRAVVRLRDGGLARTDDVFTLLIGNTHAQGLFQIRPFHVDAFVEIRLRDGFCGETDGFVRHIRQRFFKEIFGTFPNFYD